MDKTENRCLLIKCEDSAYREIGCFSVVKIRLNEERVVSVGQQMSQGLFYLFFINNNHTIVLLPGLIFEGSSPRGWVGTGIAPQGRGHIT